MDAIKEKKLVIHTPIPDFELSNIELVQRIKSYGKNKGSSYGLFVKARALKPDIDAKEFNNIWDSVSPNSHTRQKEVDFKPTHVSSVRDSDLKIMVVFRGPEIISYILSYGGTGSEPVASFDSQWRLI